jgi:PAS domain S-box-containing protein
MDQLISHFQTGWALIDALPISVYVKDRDSKFLYVNKASACSLGLEKSTDAIGKTDHLYFEPQAADEWFALEQEMMKTGKPIVDHIAPELRQGMKGDAPWVLTCKQAMRDEEGNVVGLIGISMPISSTKHGIDRISYGLEAANDGLWYRNYKTDEVWYSARWKSILGYGDKDLPNERQIFRDLVCPQDWSDVETACQRHLADKTSIYDCLFRMKHREGGWRWIHSRGKVRFGLDGLKEEFAGSHTDVTEHKNQMDLHKEILEMLPVLVFLKDEHRRFRYVNNKVEEFFDRQKTTILDRTHEDVDSGNPEAAKFRHDDERILRGQPRELLIEEEPLTDQRTGEVRQLQTRKRLLLFPATDPHPHVLGVATDITETLRAREDLRRMRDSLTERLKALTSLVLDIEKSNSESDACETAVIRLQEFGAIFGYPSVMISYRQVIDGRPCIVAVPDYATGLWQAVASDTRRWCDVPVPEMDILPLVLEKGEPEFVVDSRTHSACAHDLALSHNIISQYVIPLRTPSLKIGTLQIAMGERTVPPDECSFYDAMAAHLSVAIERHRRLLELEDKTARLLRAAKLVAWSAAGTVVVHALKHSLNNFLMILKRTESNPVVKSNVAAMDFIKDTRRFVDHWAGLFEGHLASARVAGDETTASVEACLGDVVELLHPKAQSRSCRIMWKDTIATGLNVAVSSLYFREMISVLLTNAIDAHAKIVRIEASQVMIALPSIGRARFYAQISVCDDGHGIASDYQNQVGRFGWTSKKSAGHGVGLTIVATLAEAFEGGLTLRSGGRSVGEAETIFDLYLPIQ